MLEKPGETFLGMTGEEWHAIWYGVLDANGRFHEAELVPAELESLKQKRHYFWLGQLLGIIPRAVVAAIVIYIPTQDLRAAIGAAVALMVGDQAIGNRASK